MSKNQNTASYRQVKHACRKAQTVFPQRLPDFTSSSFRQIRAALPRQRGAK